MQDDYVAITAFLFINQKPIRDRTTCVSRYLSDIKHTYF